LAVIGDSQAVVTAGLASHCGGQTVLLSPGPGRTGPSLRLEGLYSGPIQVRVIERPTADVYIAVSTSAGLEALLAEYRELLAGRVLLLAPGGFGGAIRAHRWFRRWGVKPPVIAEATGFPAIGEGEGTITLRGIKRNLPIAGLDHADTDEVLTAVRDHLPDVVAADLATTSMSNTNHLLHPVLMLLNAERVRRGEQFRLFREGLPAELEPMLAAADAERLAVVERIGGEPVSITNWLLNFYRDQGMTGTTITECLTSFPGFAGVQAPTTLEHRYLLDDVPHGIAGYQAVARQIGVATPELDSLISATERLLGRSLQADSSLVRPLLDAASAAGPAADRSLAGAGTTQSPKGKS